MPAIVFPPLELHDEDLRALLLDELELLELVGDGRQPALELFLVLLQLVAAEDDNLFRLFFLERDLRKLLAKRTCPARDEDGLILPVHEYSLLPTVVETQESKPHDQIS